MSILKNTHFEFDFNAFKERLDELNKIKKQREFTDEENADYLTIYEILNDEVFENSKKPNIFNIKKRLDKNIKDFNYFTTQIQKDYIKKIPCNSNLINIIYEDCFDIKKKELSYEKQEELLKKIFGFNSVSKNMIDYMFDETNHTFSYKKDNNNFFTQIDNKPYMSINKNNTIGAFLDLVHEFGHFYDYLTRSTNYNSDKKTLLYDEVFSLFFELKAVNELKNNNLITDEETLMLFTHIQETNMDNYYFVYTAMESDFHYYPLKKLLNDLKNKNNKTDYIKEYIKQLFNLTLREKIGFCNLEFEFPEISEYNFSYLLALTLFYSSENNPNKTLEYLHLLNNCLNENTEQEILSRIYCDKDRVIETVTRHNEKKILKRNN